MYSELGRAILDFEPVTIGPSPLNADSLAHYETYQGHALSISLRQPAEPQYSYITTSDARRISARVPYSKPLKNLAWSAGLQLMVQTAPEGAQEMWPDFWRRMTDHLDSKVETLDRWPTSDWELDGSSLLIRSWTFAGGWLAVAQVDTRRVLAAHGWGHLPNHPSLRSVPISELRLRDPPRLQSEDVRDPSGVTEGPRLSPHSDHIALLGF